MRPRSLCGADLDRAVAFDEDSPRWWQNRPATAVAAGSYRHGGHAEARVDRLHQFPHAPKRYPEGPPSAEIQPEASILLEHLASPFDARYRYAQ